MPGFVNALRPNAGKYLLFVNLQQNTVTKVNGNKVDNWTTIGRFPAAIRPLFGTETTVISNQTEATVSHSIEMPHLGTAYVITAEMQFTYCVPGYPTRTFGIVSVLNVEEGNHTYRIGVLERT